MTLKRRYSSSASSYTSSRLPASLPSSERPPPSKILKLGPPLTSSSNTDETFDKDWAVAPSYSALDLTNSAAGPSNSSKKELAHSYAAKDHFSTLSDELLIRILHHLPVECVLLCSLVSRKFRRLSADAQVWKGLYYGRFVRPRALRIPGVAKPPRSSSRLEVEEGEGGDGFERKTSLRSDLPSFNSRKSKWLDEVKLLGVGEEEGKDEEGAASQNSATDGRARRRRKVTDWKARYRLRHNWSIGAAEVRKIDVDIDGGLDSATEDEGISDYPTPNISQRGTALMASLVDGMVVTVDSAEGLRAWDIKTKECLAQSPLIDQSENPVSLLPTSLAVDTGPESLGRTGIVVGFTDGTFGIWTLMIRSINAKGSFERWYRTPVKSQTAGEHGRLIAVAYSHPHLLTITSNHILSLYVFEEEIDYEDSDRTENTFKVSKHLQPCLLASLKSHTSWPPVTLSIRSTPHSIIASIAYAIPAYLSGWSVGLQELHLTPSGTILRSRLASAVEQGFQSLLSSSTPPSSASRSPRSVSSDRNALPDQSRALSTSHSHPISLSYSHPYLLAGNRDNTLSLYLVTSNNEELKISKSTTLWGHTSSVASALVGGRGKAVSVSAKGGELRVWELERGLGRKTVGERSVRVRSDVHDVSAEERASLDVGDGAEPRQDYHLKMQSRGVEMGWVGFDDEVVIVLRGEDEMISTDSRGRRRGRGSEAEKKRRTLVVYDFT